jgi:hypothetical protein
MQKRMFVVTCSDVLFIQFVPFLPEHEKIVRQRFTPWMHQNALRVPQIPPVVKTQIPQNVSQCAFSEIRTGPTRA